MDDAKRFAKKLLETSLLPSIRQRTFRSTSTTHKSQVLKHKNVNGNL